MSQTTLDYLWRPSSPWISVGYGEEARRRWVPSHFFAKEGIATCTRRLRGSKMRNVEQLMTETAAAFQFSDEFGENWYALEESLCYLDESLPADAYVVLIEDIDDILVNDDAGMRALLRTFSNVGEFWSRPVDQPEQFRRPARPFHVLFYASPGQGSGIERIDTLAKDEGISILKDDAADV